AYPMCAAIVKSCVDSAFQLGLPEAAIPLAEAVILMATAPKSNSAEKAIMAALADVRAGRTGEIPADIKDAHYGGAAKLGHGTGYRYSHDYPNHWVRQQYLPDELVGTTYYTYGENKTEQAARAYWEKIKGE
ncbi:MAG: replication-associated recombination protein A, partial [Butyricicoccus sp.]